MPGNSLEEHLLQNGCVYVHGDRTHEAERDRKQGNRVVERNEEVAEQTAAGPVVG